VVRAVSGEASAEIIPPALSIGAPSFPVPTFPRRSFDITAFGAVGDGRTDCTGAIADAIDQAHAGGGGTVRIPAGQWFTGPIRLQSNIDLHLAEGSVLRFSDDPTRYLPGVFVRAFGQECFSYSPLIYAHDCTRIAITGPGAIEGRGERWWGMAKAETRSVQRLYEQVLAGIPPAQRRFDSEGDPIRPPLIGFIGCDEVLLEGFTIREGGPLWSVHLAYCSRSTARSLKIDTSEGPNNDCIVIDSCQDVVVEQCDLKSRDDCVAIKSGLNEDGWRVARPTQNVVVRHLRARGGAAALAVGSEMSGDVRDLLVEHVEASGVECGVRFKAARGRGGVIERAHVRDLRLVSTPGEAIHLTTDHSAYLSPDGKSPIIRNVVFERIRCDEAKNAARLVGLPDRCIEDVLFRDVDLSGEQGFQCFSAQRIHLVNARVNARIGPAFSLRDTRGVYIDGLHQPPSDRVYLDLRGRLTRDVRLAGEFDDAVRPVIVLGVDVPRDAIFLD
jgi:polygalacturonase